ncbi:hypothetical protein AK812_SmicGene18942 [Symbiodinium microadriaticum]|uniref:Uncharacterized protein n=1 Tax=Symbiodinium microadriaticum TaxID=2951 RepID=A0A1Q9DTW2_SYMMI|nr:hypothetical protein AK812_SmicGene18942 [Symbiodinium microadriaticum]CAE7036744.1 unnamed protein product [Symbiodinium sp. KB8]CAE7252998.1 unnamed protein product [Symbiodinium microadriaticum]
MNNDRIGMEDESEADDEGFAAPSEELIASLQARYDNFAQGLPVQSEDELPAESPPAEETPARNKFRSKSSWEVICIEDDEVRVPAEQAQASSVNSRQSSSSSHPQHGGVFFDTAAWSSDVTHPAGILCYTGESQTFACFQVCRSLCRLLKGCVLFGDTGVAPRPLPQLSAQPAGVWAPIPRPKSEAALQSSVLKSSDVHALKRFYSSFRLASTDDPLSNAQNVLKALRWHRKLLSLSVLPDLYGPAFSTMAAGPSKEKKESVPLPLSFHAFLKRQVLTSDTPVEKAIFCGSVLACIGASLRFADAQHVLWSSLCPSAFSLRGICYRTKTTSRGGSFGLIGFGLHCRSEDWGSNWLPKWIQLLDEVWANMKSSFGQGVVPDCLFCHFSESGFAPASYAQTLCRLRQLLLEAEIPASQVSEYTLHSMKSTYLSWMAQLNIPLSARFLQGHHKIPGSAQLYSRDDIWPALRAQLLLWRSRGRFQAALPTGQGRSTASGGASGGHQDFAVEHILSQSTLLHAVR